MEIIIILLSILQSVGVSLGVGSSTLAICNFFVAIADGEIDLSERRLMGVVYITLRVAMVLILVTTLALTVANYLGQGTSYLTPFIVGFWILISVLYINAVLMTKHIMPSSVGPALQASTWYTMGVLVALVPLGLNGFSLFHFALGYATAILLAISLVNALMHELKHRSPKV